MLAEHDMNYIIERRSAADHDGRQSENDRGNEGVPSGRSGVADFDQLRLQPIPNGRRPGGNNSNNSGLNGTMNGNNFGRGGFGNGNGNGNNNGGVF